MAKKTPWFPISIKPKRPGQYEGRQKGTQCVIPDIHWRRLEDTDHYDWYVCKGILGPFLLWECVSDKITSWRGLAAPSESDVEKT